jgi:hypothetical protein
LRDDILVTGYIGGKENNHANRRSPC